MKTRCPVCAEAVNPEHIYCEFCEAQVVSDAILSSVVASRLQHRAQRSSVLSSLPPPSTETIMHEKVFALHEARERRRKRQDDARHIEKFAKERPQSTEPPKADEKRVSSGEGSQYSIKKQYAYAKRHKKACNALVQAKKRMVRGGYGNLYLAVFTLLMSHTEPIERVMEWREAKEYCAQLSLQCKEAGEEQLTRSMLELFSL